MVTEHDDYTADIGVRGGCIAAIAQGLAGEAPVELAVHGMLVLPGGVDTHCQVEQKLSSGLMTADDFHSASVSAACGGTTTIVPFAAQHRDSLPTSSMIRGAGRGAGRDRLRLPPDPLGPDRARALRGAPGLDAGRPSRAEDLHAAHDALKVTDRQLLDVLAAARAHGGLVMVHAENHDAIAWCTADLLGEGLTAPRYHAAARPRLAEREATHRAIALAELARAPVFIVQSRAPTRSRRSPGPGGAGWTFAPRPARSICC